MLFIFRLLTLATVILLATACGSQLETGLYEMSATGIEDGCSDENADNTETTADDLAEIPTWFWVLEEGEESGTFLVTEEYEGSESEDKFTLEPENGIYVYQDSWLEGEKGEEGCFEESFRLEVEATGDGLKGSSVVTESSCGQEEHSCSWTYTFEGTKQD